MAHYYVDVVRQPQAKHRLMHLVGCPSMANKVLALGEHVHCHYALEHAREWYQDAEGCPQCVPLCSGVTVTQLTHKLYPVSDKPVPDGSFPDEAA